MSKKRESVRAKPAVHSTPTPHKAIQEIAAYMRRCGYKAAIIGDKGGAVFGLRCPIEEKIELYGEIARYMKREENLVAAKRGQS